MEEKYGKIVYEVKNEEIVKATKKSFKNYLMIGYVGFVFCMIFGIGLATGIISTDDELDKNVGIGLIVLSIIMMISVEYRRRKNAKKDIMDYCTCIYENGLVFNQGKLVEIGFDKIKSMDIYRRRVYQPYNIYLYTTNKKTAIVIGDFGAPIATDIKEFYSELTKAFANYKARVENENNTKL